MQKRIIECCCTSPIEAAEAEAGGAARIELCECLEVGGVTPSAENIVRTIASVTIPVNVLIRPREGDFVYNEAEIDSMLDSIRFCKQAGVNGVVVGALLSDGRIDTATVGKLIAEARPLKITFHRAFDECRNPVEALETVIGLGCERLLTAGHAPDVERGCDCLARLVEQAGDRIVILAGSGIRPANIAAIEQRTHAREFHSSSRGSNGTTDRRVVSELVDSAD